MQITLSPQSCFDRLTLARQGETLTINGVIYDFTQLLDGATLPRDAVDCEWLVSDVARTNGVLHLTLILPHGSNAPEETRFPSPITVTQDGRVALPAYEVKE